MKYLTFLILIFSIGCKKTQEIVRKDEPCRLSKHIIDGKLMRSFEYNSNGRLDKVYYHGSYQKLTAQISYDSQDNVTGFTLLESPEFYNCKINYSNGKPSDFELVNGGVGEVLKGKFEFDSQGNLIGYGQSNQPKNKRVYFEVGADGNISKYVWGYVIYTFFDYDTSNYPISVKGPIDPLDSYGMINFAPTSKNNCTRRGIVIDDSLAYNRPNSEDKFEYKYNSQNYPVAVKITANYNPIVTNVVYEYENCN